MTPEQLRRARDELRLVVLACWDAGWSMGEVAAALELKRSVVAGTIYGVSRAAPDALARKPQERCGP